MRIGVVVLLVVLSVVGLGMLAHSAYQAGLADGQAVGVGYTTMAVPPAGKSFLWSWVWWGMLAWASAIFAGILLVPVLGRLFEFREEDAYSILDPV